MLARMLKLIFGLNRTTKLSLQMLADAICIFLAFGAALAVKHETAVFLLASDFWLVTLFTIAASILLFFQTKIYKTMIRYLSSGLLTTILNTAFLSTGVLMIGSWLFSLTLHATTFLMYFVFLLLCISSSRVIVKHSYLSIYSPLRKNVAIYGSNEAGRQLLGILRAGQDYNAVMFLDDETEINGIQISGLPTFKLFDGISKFEQHDIQAVLIAKKDPNRIIQNKIIVGVEHRPVQVKIIPDLEMTINGHFNKPPLQALSISDLLGRESIPPVPSLLAKQILKKVVLVTGAGGSIGSELCRQIIKLQPDKLLLMDSSEFALYSINAELSALIRSESLTTECLPILCSVKEESRVSNILATFSVDTIYHAAAYKHVPLVEQNVTEGLSNNVFGALVLAEAAINNGVNNFILVSSDKAVRPTNYMGASKRIAEIICQSLGNQQRSTKFAMVRFGNVLGSSGSVIPIFEKQIKEGGPVTLTHEDVTRYFMTTEEAAQLVIQAGSMSEGGEVFVLDMGKPIKILDLAKKMITLHDLVPHFGTSPNQDPGYIWVKTTGLRPGEKLYEELFFSQDVAKTEHPRIMKANEKRLDITELYTMLSRLKAAIGENDLKGIREVISNFSIGFEPDGKSHDLIWNYSSSDD